MDYITGLIRSLSVSGRLKGLRYLASSVEIAVEDENALFGVMMEIYPIVAQKYQTTVACVERDIRTVINTCWENGGRERLCEFAGYKLSGKPTVSEMIDILANYVRKSRSIKDY